MKMFIVCLALTLTVCGCRKAPEVGAACPELNTLGSRNAARDAGAAFAKGDHRLLLIMHGYGPSVPGAESSTLPRRLLPGTSDNESKRCYRLWGGAVDYAKAYNRRIVLLDQHKPSTHWPQS